MNHFCRQASRLISDRYERKLTPLEQTRLHMHLLICGMCRNYSNSIALMHRTLADLQQQQACSPLPEAVRQRILLRLQSEP